jgi:hypothetical protein
MGGTHHPPQRYCANSRVPGRRGQGAFSALDTGVCFQSCVLRLCSETFSAVAHVHLTNVCTVGRVALHTCGDLCAFPLLEQFLRKWNVSMERKQNMLIFQTNIQTKKIKLSPVTDRGGL